MYYNGNKKSEDMGDITKWVISQNQKSSNLHLNSFCFGYRVTNPKIFPDFLAISLWSEYIRKKITVLKEQKKGFMQQMFV